MIFMHWENNPFTLPTTEIIINSRAIKKIMLHAIEFSNPNSSKLRWKEVIGILGGKIEDGIVKVTNSFPITHGSHYYVTFKKKNYIMSAIINSILSEKGEFFVGWYHSHPGIGFFYSETDIINHIGYQDVNPRAIGLVFDHEGYKKRKKFFEIYTLNFTRLGKISYSDVNYEIEDISKNKEIEKLKEIYDRLLFYWKLNFVESGEKTVKKWLKNVEKEY